MLVIIHIKCIINIELSIRGSIFGLYFLFLNETICCDPSSEPSS